MDKARMTQLVEQWADGSLEDDKAEELLRFLESCSHEERQEILRSLKMSKVLMQFHAPRNVHLSEKVTSAIRTTEDRSHLTDSIMISLASAPLKDVSMTNVKKQNIRFYRYCAFVVAACLLIAVGIFSMTPRYVIGTIASTADGSTIYRNNKFLVAHELSGVRPGDSIRTKNGFSMIYEDSSLVDVGADSVVHINGTDEQKSLSLEKGTLFATVNPQKENTPFLLKTADMSVEVIGTEFVLHAYKKGSSIRVEKGTVRVTDAGDNPYLVTAGQSFFAKNGVTRWLGFGSEESFLSAQGYLTEELDLSVIAKNRYGDVSKDRYLGDTFLTQGHALNIFSCRPEGSPFHLTEKIICHITFKTDAFRYLHVTFDQDREDATSQKLKIRKNLDKDYINMWQTVSIPLSDFEKAKDEAIEKDGGEYPSIHVHAYDVDKKKKMPQFEKGTYFEVGSIWFTEKK